MQMKNRFRITIIDVKFSYFAKLIKYDPSNVSLGLKKGKRIKEKRI